MTRYEIFKALGSPGDHYNLWLRERRLAFLDACVTSGLEAKVWTESGAVTFWEWGNKVLECRREEFDAFLLKSLD